MKNNLKGVCFGEVLFDVFLNHRTIGGAPLNVAARLKSFGVDVAIVSAIGNDNEGKEIIDFVDSINLDSSKIQIKENYPTGIVNVILDENKNASYNINYPSAWDKISLEKSIINSVSEADFFVYGSLSSRDIVSRNTLKQLLNIAKYRVFDVNLRKPHYSKQTLFELMTKADFIKLNENELMEVSLDLKSSSILLEQNIKFISDKTKTSFICVTLGSQGAILYINDKYYYNSGYSVSVVNTVGAGDSFLAALIYKLFTDENPQRAIDYACAVGALVAKSKGANPKITSKNILDVINGV